MEVFAGRERVGQVDVHRQVPRTRHRIAVHQRRRDRQLADNIALNWILDTVDSASPRREQWELICAMAGERTGMTIDPDHAYLPRSLSYASCMQLMVPLADDVSLILSQLVEPTVTSGHPDAA
ncbi:MAG: hypothetical protein ACSLFR_00015 [Solirubrobacteraceae bacterium]